MRAAPNWRDLNAFIHLDAEYVAGRPRSESASDESAGAESLPLSRFTLAIKDNIEVAGMACTAGTPILRDYVPRFDAPSVARLRAAGACVAGKANLHELAYGITSNNYAFGPVRNAIDPDYFAGGSSGGTAAAIASGVVRAGLGTDTGGSSRIPAALNGIVGLRPSTGRYPMAGVARISPTRDVIGPMARNVSDVALLDAVLADCAAAQSEMLELRGLRIGLPTRHFQDSLHPDVTAVLHRSVALLRDAGAVIVEADLQEVATLNAAVSFPIVLFETARALRKFLRHTGLPISIGQLYDSIASPDVKELVGLALHGHVSESAYQRAVRDQRPRLQRLYAEYFETHRVEAVLFPTTPLPACLVNGSDATVPLNGSRVPTFATFIRNTDPGSNAGIPGISLPAGFSSKNLPVGIELDGPVGSDRRLLAVAAAVEAVLKPKSMNPKESQ
jgi:mandelamide amidase